MRKITQAANVLVAGFHVDARMKVDIVNRRVPRGGMRSQDGLQSMLPPSAGIHTDWIGWRIEIVYDLGPRTSFF